MFDSELSVFHTNDMSKFDNPDFINNNDIERSGLDKDADDYSEQELLRETLIKNGWKKL